MFLVISNTIFLGKANDREKRWQQKGSGASSELEGVPHDNRALHHEQCRVSINQMGNV